MSSIRAQFIHQPLHPDEVAEPVAVTPKPDTDIQQLVRRWSVKSAPTRCIHIPIVTDLYGVDTGLLSSPSTGPGCRAEGSQVLQVWPSASTLVTVLCFDISLLFMAWPLRCLPLQPLAVCNSDSLWMSNTCIRADEYYINFLWAFFFCPVL